MADQDPLADDQRVVELEALQAIFPEIVMHPTDPFSFSLEMPVTPEQPVTAVFAATDTHVLAHLPPVHIAVSLPADYPADAPPTVALSTTPAWLPAEVLPALESASVTLWENVGHDQVVYDYIVHVQEAAETVFGLAVGPEPLVIDPIHRLGLLEHDAKSRREAFERESFDCGVCLDRKYGAQCHRMQDCGHVFCVQCLQDFYTDAIKDGALATVRCLEPNCAKSREQARAAAAAAAADAGEEAAATQGQPPQQIRISPGELLQIPLDESIVKRYVDLSYKTALEADKTVVYCPRAWCDGVARPRPTTTTTTGTTGSETAEDLLAICQSCQLAFCCRCYQTWHGYLFHCRPRKTNGELTEEDKATLEYMKRNTTACCTCDVPAQKTDGCNHMVCARCNTHFCYLCAAWLNPNNPYVHFSDAPDGSRTACYGRLWESRDVNSGYVYDAFLDGADDEDGDDGDDHHHAEGEWQFNEDDWDENSDAESEQDFQDAVEVFQANLDQDPNGPRAQHWRDELDRLYDRHIAHVQIRYRNRLQQHYREHAANLELQMRQRQQRLQQHQAMLERRRAARQAEAQAAAAAAAAAVPRAVNVAVEGPLVMRIAMEPVAAAPPPVQNNNNNNNNGVPANGAGNGHGRRRRRM